jgi:hypothetical protein
MSDDRDKNMSKSDGARLAPAEQVWLEKWTDTTGQPKSVVLRAAARTLRYLVGPMDESAAVRLIASLAGKDEKADSEAELWAALAHRQMREASTSGKRRGPATGRK